MQGQERPGAGQQLEVTNLVPSVWWLQVIFPIQLRPSLRVCNNRTLATNLHL
jgi:hypothetical protein